MSIEPKYHLTENQLDDLIEYNKRIIIHRSIFFFSIMALMAPVFSIIIIGNFQHIHIIMKLWIILVTISSIISGVKLLELRECKKLLIENIRKTAHYSKD